MKQIRHCWLGFAKKQSVRSPSGAEILSVTCSPSGPMLHLLCEWGRQADEDFIIEMFIDGEQIPCDMGVERRFIGSVVGSDGFPYHFFERKGV